MRALGGLAGAFFCAAALTSGCGGGGSDKQTPPPRTLSGTLAYDKVPASASGLDYAATYAMPIRGATVELMDGSTIAATTASDSAGHYAFSWPASGPSIVVVRVKALTSQPVIRVEDNTAGDALYAMVSPAVNNDTVTTLNLNAPSGWGGSSYTGARVAAPFAVLDTAYACARAFMAERTVVFPDLKINWSVNNRAEPGDKALGQIETSHWDGTELYILGLADADTDEFDDHIIAHEWGHYFESKMSRSDSPGGMHGAGEIKDPRLSWGEGWATALGAIVLYPDDLYVDTLGARQATSGACFSIEDNTADDPSPGWYSEMSIVHAFFDLWDPASASETFDNASLSLGALCDVMVGAQKMTEVFTTLFSFVDGLKTNNPGAATAIDTLLAYRGVASPIADPLGTGETHNGGITGALPVYTILYINDPQSDITFTSVGLDAQLILNSLGSNRFGVFLGNGSTVTVSAATAGPDVMLRLFRNGQEVGNAVGGATAAIYGYQTIADAVYTVIVTSSYTTAGTTFAGAVRVTSP
jgi:hypothetical protein